MDKLRSNNAPSLGLGAVLILAGAVFLVGQFMGENFWGMAWPLTILVPGLLLFVAMLASGKSAGGLAIPASIVTMLGLLMFYQNTFNHFESWAYAWALIPTAVGIGLIINGMWCEQPDLVKKGQDIARIGLIMFLIGFVFFEFVLRIGGRFGTGNWGGMLGPLALIVLGGYLLYRNLILTSNKPSTPASLPPAVPSVQPNAPQMAREETITKMVSSAPPSAEETPAKEKQPSIWPATPQVNGQEKEKIAGL
jgi:hypothetical protein